MVSIDLENIWMSNQTRPRIGAIIAAVSEAVCSQGNQIGVVTAEAATAVVVCSIVLSGVKAPRSSEAMGLQGPSPEPEAVHLFRRKAEVAAEFGDEGVKTFEGRSVLPFDETLDIIHESVVDLSLGDADGEQS